jgi:hypothetical protein
MNLMKDAKLYSEKLKKAFHVLKKRHGKVEKVKYVFSTDALVYAILSEKMTETAAQAAIKKLTKHFVDWNELRVSRIEEIVDVLGSDTADTRQVAQTLTDALNALFNKYDVISLESFEELGKKQAKLALAKILQCSRFVTNYVALTVFGSLAVPITPKMLDYLKIGELIHAEVNDDELEAFLERQVGTSQAYDFYAVFRRECELSKKASIAQLKKAK